MRRLRESGIGFVLTLYTLPGHDFMTPAENTLWNDTDQQRFAIELWRRLAERYRSHPARIWFEPLNEPVPDEPEAWNALQTRLVETIRAAAPQRTIVITPWRNSAARELDTLRVPASDGLVAAVHFYEPMLFTFQGLPHLWSNRDPMQGDPIGGVPYPTTPLGLTEKLRGTPAAWMALLYEGKRLDRSFLRGHIDAALDWSRRSGIPLWFGEMGATVHADPKSRDRWLGDAVGLLEEREIAWALHGYRGDFRIVEPDGSVPPALARVLSPR